MAMKWQDASEIVMGMVLNKKLDPNAVNPLDLYMQYGEMIPILRDGGDIPDVVAAVGYSSVRAAMDAAEHINGEMKPIEWIKVLKDSASRATGAHALEQVAKGLKEGKEVDMGAALRALSMMEDGYRELTPMSEVVAEANSWIKTGWRPLDDNVGGLSKASLTIIGASPGVGKTTLLLKIANNMVKKYKKQKVAIFTLEMTMAQITARWQQLDKEFTEEEKSRVLLSESSFSVDEVYASASRVAAQEKLALIAIDFADLLVEGEQSESVMGVIYKTLAMLAKKTGVPVLLISQLNRATYLGGTPKVNHLRYSGMAEAMSALILLIYNPHNILADFGGKSELQAVDGTGYLIVGKSRYGFKKGGPGGIQIGWDGEGGWGDEPLGWFNLVV